MLRYLSAVIFLAGAAYVAWYNGTHAQSVLLFPGLDSLMPSLQGDRPGQGRVTVYLFGGIGILLFLNAVRRHIRDARADGD
jgi:hypothetical protein